MAKTTLHNPDYLALDDAYRGLKRLEDIYVQSDQLDQLLSDMERVGFVAIELVEVNEDRKQYTVKASKGKHGPCKFEGAIATYTGEAIAVLDDDLHLFPKGMKVAVCEKTRSILNLPSYNKLATIDESNSDEAQTEEDKLDFETAIELVNDQVSTVSPDHANREMMFYPGPFRLLILKDGSLVRRGKWSSVPAEAARQLRAKDRMISDDEVNPVKAEFWQVLFPEVGSSILLGDESKLEKSTYEYETDFDSLKLVQEPLRGRIQRMISERKKYFILVGNEVTDTFGCCPSEEVTEANKLVKSGILDTFSEPVAGDACPVTLYAFKNEMTLSEEGLKGEPDFTFREEVLTHFRGKSDSRIYLLIKWILIAFVTVSLLLGMRNCYQQQFGDSVTQVTFQRINPENKFQAVLVLFHNQKRCFQCLEMEKLSHDLLENTFSESETNRSIGFSTLEIDDPASAELVEQFGIFAATLVLIDYSDPGNPFGKVLNKAPVLYRDRDAFTQYLESELEVFLD